MSLHRYPIRAIAADYVRSGVGLGVTAGPLIAIGFGSVTSYALALAAVLFAVYGGRTAIRNTTTLEVTDDGLSCRGLRPVSLKWADLRHMKLAYFSLKRWGNKAGFHDGWMQLTLAGETGNLMIESTLDGFGGVVRCAAAAARAKGLKLDSTTQANLLAMGVFLPRDQVDG
ncbi:MAG: hypothetical protein U1E97_07270 [Alphaproteobacteria bacterium]